MKRRSRRQLGAGMTEYIILVGLVGLLLIPVVGIFKNQIEITLVGGDSNAGMAGGIDNNITNEIENMDEEAPPAPPNNGGGGLEPSDEDRGVFHMPNIGG